MLAINPLLEASDGEGSAARRVPAGNLCTRLLGMAIGLAVLPKFGLWLVEIEPNLMRVVADFHLGFNLLVAILFFPVLPHYVALLRRLFSVRVDAPDPSSSTRVTHHLLATDQQLAAFTPKRKSSRFEIC
jgi:phosphate:Na+ symporter